MKKIVNIVSGIFLALGIAFACLPFGTDTLGFLPAVVALLLAAVSFLTTKNGKRKVASVLLIAAVTVVLLVLVRNLTSKNEVRQDDRFEVLEAESLQELQDLDADLEGTESTLEEVTEEEGTTSAE